ncbi:MAG TPA: DNA-directed RNA polymerase subunit omega [Thermodesulfobacteriota bacterium]|nr:DNA-directed RNA polymerase subunit omega [Thermodesulfobacteriota bacterium]
MARISVEDCLRAVPNRFALVLLAAARTKQLYKGSEPRVKTDNKEIVLALREIAAGKVEPAQPLEADLLRAPVETIPDKTED